MKVVASITLDQYGNPTSGAGDVLIGDRAEHVADVARRLAVIAGTHDVDVDAEELEQHAEAIVGAHRIVAPDEPIEAPDGDDAPAGPPTNGRDA